jgi:hypothetical protein
MEVPRKALERLIKDGISVRWHSCTHKSFLFGPAQGYIKLFTNRLVGERNYGVHGKSYTENIVQRADVSYHGKTSRLRRRLLLTRVGLQKETLLAREK